MSLTGDALSHAVLPGAALGFILGGLSFAGDEPRQGRRSLVVALLSGLAYFASVLCGALDSLRALYF